MVNYYYAHDTFVCLNSLDSIFHFSRLKYIASIKFATTRIIYNSNKNPRKYHFLDFLLCHLVDDKSWKRLTKHKLTDWMNLNGHWTDKNEMK